MQFLAMLLSALALAASTTTTTAAHIAARSKDGVVSLRITSPKKDDIWSPPGQQLVQWDTSEIPTSAVKHTGSIVLGYDDGSGSDHLYLDDPLAKGFLLTDGSQTVTVPPQMPYGTNYFVILFGGDSANRSPEFTIWSD